MSDEKITKEEFVNNCRRGLLNFRNDPTSGALDEEQPRSVWRQRLADAREAIAKTAVDTKRVTKAQAERQELLQRLNEAGITATPKAEMIEHYDTAMANKDAELADLRSKLATAEADLEAVTKELRARPK